MATSCQFSRESNHVFNVWAVWEVMEKKTLQENEPLILRWVDIRNDLEQEYKQRIRIHQNLEIEVRDMPSHRKLQNSLGEHGLLHHENKEVSPFSLKHEEKSELS